MDDIEVEDACKDPRSKEVAFVEKNDLYGMVRYNGLYAVEPYFANMTPAPYSLYNESLASFKTGDMYDHHDAEGFITLFGLPLKVRAMKMQEAKSNGKTE